VTSDGAGGRSVTGMTATGDPAARALELLLLDDPAVAAWLTRTALAAGDDELAASVARTAQALADAHPGYPALAAAAAHSRGLARGDPALLAQAGLGIRRRHGASRPGRPVAGWESLTDTEQAVAGLVAQGLSNGQIGGRMYISTHTVAHHLRRRSASSASPRASSWPASSSSGRRRSLRGRPSPRATGPVRGRSVTYVRQGVSGTPAARRGS